MKKLLSGALVAMLLTSVLTVMSNIQPVAASYASIGDFVWEDLNGDGIQDAGEPGIFYVIVRLYDGDDTLLNEHRTDQQGFYGFVLYEGFYRPPDYYLSLPFDYYIEFVLPDGYAFTTKDEGADDAVDSDADPTTGKTDTASIDSWWDDSTGDWLAIMTWDAGVYRPASIGDRVWEDTNGNGIQDVGEPGIGGVTVNLYGSGGFAGTTTTDTNGIYGFDDLAPGDYYLEFIQPAGYVFSPRDQGSDDAVDSDADTATGQTIWTALESGENDSTWDAGLYPEVVQECGECKGKVTELTLRYNGSVENAPIRVEQKGKNGGIVFDDIVQPGGEFTFSGIDKNGTLGTEISVYVGGALNTKIHTSCSQPIGPGLVSGDFEVVEGYSREGGLLCPIGETPPPPPPPDGECDGGVTALTLRNNGDEGYIVVTSKKKSKVLFEGTVASGGQFSFVGQEKHGKLGSEIRVSVDGGPETKIHTSCSQPIATGMVFGGFEIVAGTSLKGGQLP